MKHVAVLVVLITVWLVFVANLTVQAVSVGVVLSVAAVIVFRNLTGGTGWLGRSEAVGPRRCERRPVRRRLGAALAFLLFVPVFLWKVTVSGMNIAFLALKPSIDFWPGIVRVRGGLRSISATVFFANLMTLTPGTLTLDYDEQHDDLYVHWIDVTGYGEDDLDSRVTSGLRTWLKRMDL